MKALSIHQPYADQIMRTFKDAEVRSWETDYRGDLLICSTIKPIIKNLDCFYGCALCVVELTNIWVSDIPIDDQRRYWQLENVRLIKPFPVKGQQRLFNVDDGLIEYLKEVSDE